MAHTDFVDGLTLSAEDWFNDVDRLHYTIFGDPATVSAARNTLMAAADVVAHATTSNIWGAREVTLTGAAVTFTDIVDAPVAGAVAWVKQNAAHVWTNGATFAVQGGANYTAAAGDWIRVYATTVSTFEITIFRLGDAPSTQAQQETGTDVLSYVTPGRQQYHPSAAKAWCFADSIGGVVAGYNVTSITDQGPGQAVAVWNVDFSSASYCPGATVNFDGILATTISNVNVAMTADQACAQAYNAAGELVDPNHWSIWAFGDQA